MVKSQTRKLKKQPNHQQQSGWFERTAEKVSRRLKPDSEKKKEQRHRSRTPAIGGVLKVSGARQARRARRSPVPHLPDVPHATTIDDVGAMNITPPARKTRSQPKLVTAPESARRATTPPPSPARGVQERLHGQPALRTHVHPAVANFITPAREPGSGTEQSVSAPLRTRPYRSSARLTQSAPACRPHSEDVQGFPTAAKRTRVSLDAAHESRPLSPTLSRSDSLASLRSKGSEYFTASAGEDLSDADADSEATTPLKRGLPGRRIQTPRAGARSPLPARQRRRANNPVTAGGKENAAPINEGRVTRQTARRQVIAAPVASRQLRSSRAEPNDGPRALTGDEDATRVQKSRPSRCRVPVLAPQPVAARVPLPRNKRKQVEEPTEDANFAKDKDGATQVKKGRITRSTVHAPAFADHAALPAPKRRRIVKPAQEVAPVGSPAPHGPDFVPQEASPTMRMPGGYDPEAPVDSEGAAIPPGEKESVPPPVIPNLGGRTMPLPLRIAQAKVANARAHLETTRDEVDALNDTAQTEVDVFLSDARAIAKSFLTDTKARGQMSVIQAEGQLRDALAGEMASQAVHARQGSPVAKQGRPPGTKKSKGRKRS